MDNSVIKRNYLYFILLLLKEETSDDGKHLSAKDIADHFEAQYGVRPERKTIYTVMDDLLAMGFDIHLEKGKRNPGYYLGRRPIGDAELHLLVDGIESIDDLKADDKRDIEEKLCKELGYSFDTLDFHLYEKRNPSNDNIDAEEEDSFFPISDASTSPEKIEAIQEAIRKDRQITFYDCFPDYGRLDLIEEMSEEDEEAYFDSLVNYFSPYKILRNSLNELCLLYYLTINGHHYPGFGRIENHINIRVSNRPRPKVEDESIFPSDLSNYENGRDYQIGNQLREATLSEGGMDNPFYLEEILKDCCESYEKVTIEGSTSFVITYKLRKEKEIVDKIIAYLPNIYVLPPSKLFNRMAKIRIGLCKTIDERAALVEIEEEEKANQAETDENGRPLTFLESAIRSGLVDKIKEWIKERRRFRVSTLERHFSIIYPNALDIVDLLLEEGFIKAEIGGAYEVVDR